MVYKISFGWLICSNQAEEKFKNFKFVIGIILIVNDG